MRASISHRLEHAAVRTAVRALRLVPFGRARAIGAWLGRLAFAPLGVRRKVVLRQLAAAFPERDPAQVRRLAREAYAHFGRVLVETALLPYLRREELLALVESEEGFAAFERAVGEGRGVVIVSGHLGNWELAGAYVAARGVPLDVIVRRLNNPLVDAYVNETRERIGMGVIRDSEAVRRIPRAFAGGRAIAFVADQGVMNLASTFVPFFGRPAKTPRGPAVFALRSRIPVFFITCVRGESGRYRCLIIPVDVIETGDREADVDATVAVYTRQLESLVRRFPEQYFWHHRRWRRQPENTPPALRDPVTTAPNGARR